ncbi:MAG: DUF6547 family protein [Tepidisphaerales bacterium]
MPKPSKPSRPIDVYKAIIDELVNETRRSGHAKHVKESSLFSNAPAHRTYNLFIASLTPKHRNLVSQMLQDERDGAIHDLLAMLSWWIDCREVGFTFCGKPMPVDLSGMGLHGDYIGRRDGWKWPAENESAGK